MAKEKGKGKDKGKDKKDKNKDKKDGNIVFHWMPSWSFAP